jgi:trans-aconitate methyltransferase
MFRNVDAKSPASIVAEGDALAPIRFRQIMSGADLSYRQVLVPSIIALASKETPGAAFDAGCGIGYLTHLLAERIGEVTGLDPSAESIAIARAHYGKRATFCLGTLEVYSKQNAQSADLLVANMVLMDVLDLDHFIAAAHFVLRPGGALVFSTTHPCFWPTYYGYAQEPWYRYDQELLVESPFRISAEPDCPLVSTHVHRPLNTYVQALRSHLFSIEILSEPMPSSDVEAHYPAPWKYPRYLVGLCRR